MLALLLFPSATRGYESPSEVGICLAWRSSFKSPGSSCVYCLSTLRSPGLLTSHDLVSLCLLGCKQFHSSKATALCDFGSREVSHGFRREISFWIHFPPHLLAPKGLLLAAVRHVISSPHDLIFRWVSSKKQTEWYLPSSFNYLSFLVLIKNRLPFSHIFGGMSSYLAFSQKKDISAIFFH